MPSYNLPEIYAKLRRLGYKPCKDNLDKHKTRWVKNFNDTRRNLMIYVCEYDFSQHKHIMPKEDPGVHFDIRIYFGNTDPAAELALYGLGWNIDNLWKAIEQAEELMPKLLDFLPEEVQVDSLE
jgi:hypothetical protein